MRVVFDSHVIIAAFATHGLCHSLFEFCLRSQEIIISKEILSEIEQKLRHKIKAPTSIVKATLSYLKEHCILEEPAPVPKDACRDPKDLPILGLAVAAKAEFLVSGDADLLVLKHYHKSAILSPRQMYEYLRQK
ncbi:MAG: putative toxin-antitoxin system toxin component, PIN family [Elusimicrobiota bacterium]